MEPTQTTVNLVLYVIIAIVIGFISGFYAQSGKISRLERELEAFKQKEAILDTLSAPSSPQVSKEVLNSLSAPKK